MDSLFLSKHTCNCKIRHSAVGPSCLPLGCCQVMSQQANHNHVLSILRLRLRMQGDVSGANSKARKAKDLREQISGLEFKLETAQTAASELSKLGNNGDASGTVAHYQAKNEATQPSTASFCSVAISAGRRRIWMAFTWWLQYQRCLVVPGGAWYLVPGFVVSER